MDVYIVIRIDHDPNFNKNIAKVFLHEEDAISYIDEMRNLPGISKYSVGDGSYFYYIKRDAIQTLPIMEVIIMSPLESYKEAMFVRYNFHCVDKRYADEALERIKLYENNCSDKCTMHYICSLNDNACTIHERLKDSLLIEMAKDKGSL